MSFEAIVDDIRPSMDDGHPTIIIAHYEPMAHVSLKWLIYQKLIADIISLVLVVVLCLS